MSGYTKPTETDATVASAPLSIALHSSGNGAQQHGWERLEKVITVCKWHQYQWQSGYSLWNNILKKISSVFCIFPNNIPLSR